MQQYINKLQTSQLIHHRDQNRRLSRDLGHRGHHSQSPDDRGHLRHPVARREKRTRGASFEREDSREKRRREDDHHTRHRQPDALTHQRSRLDDSAGASSRGHRDRQSYRSTSQHSASPHDTRPSESRTQTPVAAGVQYHSDPDLTTTRSHHNRDSARDHGRSRDVSSRSNGKKQGRGRTDTRDRLLPQDERPDATGEVNEGSTEPLGISDEERMRAYISLAQKRTLHRQIAFKDSQKLRNRMIADYTSRSADHADFIASLPKVANKETNADTSDSETSCNSRLSIVDDRSDVTPFDGGDVVAKSVYATVITAPSVSSVGNTEILVKDVHCTNDDTVVGRSVNVVNETTHQTDPRLRGPVNVVNETTHQTDPRLRGRVDTKQDSMSSQKMPISAASAAISTSLVNTTGYGNTGSIRTKHEVSGMDTRESRVAQDATAPLGMLLSVLKQSCKPSQPVQHPTAVETTQSPPVANLLNMLFGQTMSCSVSRVTSSTGESAVNTPHECSKTDCLPDTGLTGIRNSQQVQTVPSVPSTVTQPCRAQDLKCAGTIQETGEIVIDISKRNVTGVTRDVESSMGDIKMDKTESMCDVSPGKIESFGDVIPDKTLSSQNVANTTNNSETNESHIRVVEESANGSVSHKDIRHCADPDSGNNSLRSSGKRHSSKHKKSSTADRSTTEFSCSSNTQQNSGRETEERTDQNDVIIPPNAPDRATFAEDCLATDSCSSQPDRTVPETCAFKFKPAETNVGTDDDEDDDDSDFAFVIDTNVSPVSSDVDDKTVSRKDEDLWDISLQSDNKQDRGHGTITDSQCSQQGELTHTTDGPSSKADSTVGRTPTVAGRTDVPKARPHIRDPRHVVKSRDNRKPDSESLRRRSPGDDSKVRSKPSSLASASKVEESDGSKKMRRLSDQQLRRRQMETCENRRPVRHHDRPQKAVTRRHSESRSVEGGISQDTQKAKCDNDRIAPSTYVSKLPGAKKESRPVAGVSAKRDHRTGISRSIKRVHRARDNLKKPLDSGGTPSNKRPSHIRTDVKSKPLTSGGNSSDKPPHRTRDDLSSVALPPHEIVLKSRDETKKTNAGNPPNKNARRARNELKNGSRSSGIPPNKSAHRARDELKNRTLISNGTPPNKSARRTRDEVKNQSRTGGGTPPNKREHHSRVDSKKNCVTSDESAPRKTTVVTVRDDVTNSLANESPSTHAVADGMHDKDTPASTDDPCVTETQDDSMEEGEILSDEGSVSASDATVKRRVVDPRSSSDGVHRTHGHGTNRQRPSHHVARHRSSHTTASKY